MADLPNCPASREEMYMASIAGQNVEVPACPQSRKEAYLNAIDERVEDLQNEIEEIKDNPDVADIVDTYADLEAYDTSTLTDKDVIRVLNDETHDGNSTYYRYSKSSDNFTYIGSSKTYDVFVGTDGTTAGAKGLVPAPATTDADKYLKSDGTWDEVDAGPTVVQTTGTSTTDVMSQAATSQLLYPSGYETTKNRIAVGGGDAKRNYSICIGNGSAGATTTGDYSLHLGFGSGTSNGDYSLGFQSGKANGASSVAFYGGQTSTKGVFTIGLEQTYASTYGYNNSAYRLLTGLYDPQSAHDAANKQYVDTAAPAALSTQNFNTLWENA